MTPSLDILITRLRAHKRAALENSKLRADLELAILELEGKAAKRTSAKRIDHRLSREAVIKALAGEPVTVTQISQVTGLVGLTVRNHIKALKKLNQAYLHRWDLSGRAPVKVYASGDAPDADRPPRKIK